jgi:hypothetical protein
LLVAGLLRGLGRHRLLEEVALHRLLARGQHRNCLL